MSGQRAVDRLLRGLLVALLLACTAGAVPALLFIGQDMERSGEFLDGIGIVIGLAMLAVVAVPTGLAGWAMRESLRSSPKAPAWALAAAVAGALVGVGFGVGYRPALAVLVLPVLLMVVAVDARRSGVR